MQIKVLNKRSSRRTWRRTRCQCSSTVLSASQRHCSHKCSLIWCRRKFSSSRYLKSRTCRFKTSNYLLLNRLDKYNLYKLDKILFDSQLEPHKCPPQVSQLDSNCSSRWLVAHLTLLHCLTKLNELNRNVYEWIFQCALILNIRALINKL